VIAGNQRDEWIVRGAAAERKNYDAFSFRRGGILIHFDPYHVGSYAEGKYEVLVPSYMLKPMMREDIIAILGW
jgi:hypothetical protein